MTTDDRSSDLGDRLVAIRRELHSRAETGLQLPNTQAIVVRELERLGLDVQRGQEISSVTAVVHGDRPGPVVLLRADMDALPLTEATGLDFAAGDGVMHACGHDLHMAGLLGAARMLLARRAELAGSVVLMFQPGEEGHAGARIMIDNGVLDTAGSRPVAAYALHVDCAIDRGTVCTRPGPMMASAGALRVRVKGTGGHAAYPQLAVDPVPVAAEMIMAIQSFAARRTPPTDPAVISVTRLRSDSEASNVLASAVDLEANIRTLSPDTLDLVRTELPVMVEAVGSAHRCTVNTEFIDSYPVTVNDPAETDFAVRVASELIDGDRIVRLDAPSMASEDFAYVLDEIPGALIFVGARPPHIPSGSAPGLHSELAHFDEDVLPLQAELLAELALRRCNADDQSPTTRGAS